MRPALRRSCLGAGTGPFLRAAGQAGATGAKGSGADLTNSVLFENAGRIGLGTTTPLDFSHVRFTDTTGSFTGLAVQNLGRGVTSCSGMLFYDQNGALGQFQGFDHSTHEYRINNFIAHSDERIKRIQGRSDATRDLATLAGIEVTDYAYTYTDAPRRG